jgi:hypothetical protein
LNAAKRSEQTARRLTAEWLYERVTARTVRTVGRRLLVDVALFALISAAAGGAAPVTPQKLYQRLLVTPFPDAQLPSDFSSAKARLSRPSRTPRSTTWSER